MQTEYLREQAERCRWLAAQADEHTKARLLKLAIGYEDRIKAMERPVAGQPRA